MAEEKDTSNDVGEDDERDTPEYGETTAVISNTEVPFENDDGEEPIGDYVVNLAVNEQPDAVTPSVDLVNAYVTDQYGNIFSRNTGSDYTTTLINELNGDGSALSGGKGSGWSTRKFIIWGLVALCILAIILAVVFLVIGKKFKKNKRSTTAGQITTTKAVVTKGVSPDSKYQPVPNV